MSTLESAGNQQISSAILMVCDAGGRIRAVSAGSTDDLCMRAGASQKHFAEIFGEASAITSWLTENIGRGRRQEDYTAQAKLENGKGLLNVKLESLKCEGELYGFALHLFPEDKGNDLRLLSEGDAVVTRQQWHDIKNHLGGLKLYATFLKKKLPVGDDQQIVEKMLKGIDVLIELLARIRRGSAQPGASGQG